MENAQPVVTDDNEIHGQVEDRSNQVLQNVDRDQAISRRRRNARVQHLTNPRDHLFYALFIKIGLVYSRLVPKRFRLVLELFVLLKGLTLFSVLSYLHFSFSRMPMNCLNTSVGSWPRNGILRVQIQSAYFLHQEVPCFYSAQKRSLLFHPCHDVTLFPQDKCHVIKDELKKFYSYNAKISELSSQCYKLNLSAYLEQSEFGHGKVYESYDYVFTDSRGRVFRGYSPGDIVKEEGLSDFYEKYLVQSEAPRHYIFEYALEFGFLRLSQDTRERLKIPIKTVLLDPDRDTCFGDGLSRFILKWFLGYDDLLMNSIKKVADSENNTGYMRNVVTGDHYQFVSSWMGRSSYIISLVLMFMFTVSISTLLRFCHQQVFFFIVHVLQMMDWNVAFAFPIAPLFTVILSLVGMETIMSEFFNDTTTSFYIILIVWAVDQFDTICCHTVVSQKYWLRFFFLYHFVFYSYHYRFNGQYSSLALASMWLLTQHSMLFFFHNYELPAMESRTRGGVHDDVVFLDEAVQLLVDGIELVAGQLPGDSQEVRAQGEGAPHDANNLFNANNDGAATGPETAAAGVASTEVQAVPPYNPSGVFAFGPERPLMTIIRTFVARHIRSQQARTAEGSARAEERIVPVSISSDARSHGGQVPGNLS